MLTQKFIAECKEIAEFVPQNLAPSAVRDDYLLLLQLILNQDFNLNQLNNDKLTSIFASFGYSLGIDRMDKFQIKGLTLVIMHSQVIYNVQNYLRVPDFNLDVVIISLWLSKNQLLIYDTNATTTYVRASKSKTVIYNNEDLLAKSIRLGKNIAETNEEANINFGEEVELTYAEETVICLSIFRHLSLDLEDNIEISLVNYYQYLKIKQYEIDVDIHFGIFKNKHYFTDADDLYALVQRKVIE